MAQPVGRVTVQACRGRVRKAKIHLELSLVRDVKGGNKSFLAVHQQQKEAKAKHGPAAK